MNPELITRVVNLIQKNGDKVVLADPTTGKAVVVMDLEAYEKLCAVPTANPVQVAAPAAAPIAPVAVAPSPASAPLPAPARVAPAAASAAAASAAPKAPELTPRMPSIQVPKLTEFSEVPPRKKAVKVSPETMGMTHVMADLTQEELIDKINRDIGAWKTAQDRRRTDELQSAAKVAPQLEAVSALEEEERFFLEPIE